MRTHNKPKIVWFCRVVCVQTKLGTLVQIDARAVATLNFYSNWFWHDFLCLCFRNQNEHKWSFSRLFSPRFITCFLAIHVHTPLVKKGSTRCCSSTHISTQSFVHSFICSLILSCIQHIHSTLAHKHTHSIYSKKSIVLRRIATAVAVVAVVTMPLFSISASFATKATLRQKR